MAANTFGEILRLTTFGESHGHAIGGVLDGMPSGILLDTDAVQHALDRTPSRTIRHFHSEKRKRHGENTPPAYSKGSPPEHR